MALIITATARVCMRTTGQFSLLKKGFARMHTFHHALTQPLVNKRIITIVFSMRIVAHSLDADRGVGCLHDKWENVFSRSDFLYPE